MARSLTGVVVIALCASLLACGTAEERKAKYRERAQEYFQQGNFAKARVALRNVLKIDPKDADAYFLFAQVEEKEKNWQNAFGAYLQVVENKPEHDRAWIKLAKFYLEARAMDKVVEIADRVLARSPGHVSAQALKITAAVVAGRAGEALHQAERLVAEAPTEVDAALLLASLYTKQNMLSKALSVLNRALEASPQSLELLDALAMTHLKQGRSGEAETAFKRIVTIEPTVLDHRLRLVAFYDQQRRYDEAEAALGEAIKLDPDSETRRLALAEYVGKRRGLEPAEASLRQASKDLPRAAKLQFALGALYESTRRPDQARALYESMRREFKEKPEGLEAQVRLAGLAWSDGKRDEAERQLQEVLKENPRSSDALMLHGRIALQHGNGKDAVQDFRLVVKDQPAKMDASLLLGRAYLMTGDVALAKESLEKAAGAQATEVEAQTLLIKLDAATGRIKEAHQRLEPLLAREPSNVALLGLAFQLQMQDKDWAHSQQTLSRLRSAGADEAAADLADGHVAAAKQDWVKADAAYLRAAERRPTAAEPLIALAQLGVRKGRLGESQARLESIVARYPQHPFAEGILGELFLMKGDAVSAQPHFETATRLNPKWTTPWVHLAQYHYARQDMATVDAVLAKGLEASPENEQLRLLSAISLNRQQRYDDAIAAYDAVLKQNPGSLLAANNLASLLVDQKGDSRSLDRALALSRGFESKSASPYLLDTLGWAHYKLGHDRDAVRLLKQATALKPDDPVLNYHLGAAYSKAGQSNDARTHLEKALVGGVPFEGAEAAKALLSKVAG